MLRAFNKTLNKMQLSIVTNLGPVTFLKASSQKMNNTFETQESHIENGAWRLAAAGRQPVKADNVRSCQSEQWSAISSS
jgi:hypothetical protein